MAARARLAEERKNWRKDHPPGFVAKPQTSKDGSVDLMTWSCLVPGKKGTDWEGGNYPVTLKFSEDYPQAPPVGTMPGIYHVNIFPDGGYICLSVLKAQESFQNVCCWRPSITIKDILVAVQELLDSPNITSVANQAAYRDRVQNPKEYSRKVRAQALKHRSDELPAAAQQ